MRFRFGLALSIVLVWATPALAQPSGDAAAEAVFEQGLAKFDAGDFHAACPLLARAVELSSTEPLGGMLTLAECYERIDRPVSAWALYKRVAPRARAANQIERADTAQRAADRLEPTLPKVRFRPGPETPPGLKVRHGSETIPFDVWDIAVPVDPGVASFTFEAEGRAPRIVTIEVPRGPSETPVVAPVLRSSSGERNGSPPGEKAVVRGGSDDAGPLGPVGIAGIVVGAVGVVGLGASLGVILDAKSKWDDALAHDCADALTECSTLDGLEDARSQGDIATGIFAAGAGLAAIVAGLLIYDLVDGGGGSKESARLNVVAAPGVASASVTVRF
ncbi:MAG: tetratricopeptide repeat protein [Polyangiaceae bacterium]|nr:tetratricopeptide repeat protein [Polyangiaceae bacterium]